MSFETLDLLAGLILAAASFVTLHLGRATDGLADLDHPILEERNDA